MEHTLRKWLKDRPPTEETLDAYLQEVPEWWNHEFKVGGGEDLAAIRKAICALANARGGEVFAGVSDRRALEGCEFNEQTLRQILTQPKAESREWYLVNLSHVVRTIISVPLRTTGRVVFILEVTPPGMPTMFLEEDGELSLYIREGESSIKATGVRALEWSRRTAREDLLRTCYLELRSLSKVIAGGMQIGIAMDLGLSVPYLTKRLEDGSIYRFLNEADQLQLLGENKGNVGYTGGAVHDIFQARYQIRRMHERHQTDDEVREVLDRLREYVESRVQSFGRYLDSQGISTGQAGGR